MSIALWDRYGTAGYQESAAIVYLSLVVQVMFYYKVCLTELFEPLSDAVRGRSVFKQLTLVLLLIFIYLIYF